jgi:flagellar biosynthesis protein
MGPGWTSVPSMDAPRFKRAVALRYWPGLPAPFLSVKASGRAAGRMEELAKEAGVPLVRDGRLVDYLYPLDAGQFVPPEYYEIVARVFAFVKTIEEA